jgi:hypothetical protein
MEEPDWKLTCDSAEREIVRVALPFLDRNPGTLRDDVLDRRDGIG